MVSTKISSPHTLLVFQEFPLVALSMERLKVTAIVKCYLVEMTVISFSDCLLDVY